MSSSSKQPSTKSTKPLDDQIKQQLNHFSASSSTANIEAQREQLLASLSKLNISSKSKLAQDVSADTLRETATFLNLPSKSEKRILAERLFKQIHKSSKPPAPSAFVPPALSVSDLEKLPRDVSEKIKGNIDAELEAIVSQPFMKAFEYLMTRPPGTIRNTLRERLLNQPKYVPNHFEVKFHTYIGSYEQWRRGYERMTINEYVAYKESTVDALIAKVNEYYDTIQKRTKDVKKNLFEDESLWQGVWQSFASLYNDEYSVTKDIGTDELGYNRDIRIQSRSYRSYILIKLNENQYATIQSVEFHIAPDYKEGHFEELFVAIYWLRKYWKGRQYKGIHTGQRVDLENWSFDNPKFIPTYSYYYPFMVFDKENFIQNRKYSYRIVGRHPAWTDKKAIHFMELFYKIFI